MSLLGKIGGLGAAYIAYKFCEDSYNGHKPKWDIAIDKHIEDEQYKYMEYGWGHWSGNPFFDHVAHWLYKMQISNWGSSHDVTWLKTNVNGFINDVVMRNIIPIGIGLGGLYYATHDILRRPVTAVFNYLRSHGNIFSTLLRGAGTLISGALTGVAYAGVGVGKLLYKGGWATVAGLGLVGFFLHRLMRTVNHTEQHEYFEEYLTGGDH